MEQQIDQIEQPATDKIVTSEIVKKWEELMTTHKITQTPLKHENTATSSLTAPTPANTKRALLIGINYFGSSGELGGCHNDIANMQEYLKKCGYTHFTVLKDSKNDPHFRLPDAPTKANIESAMVDFVAGAHPGDSLYVHYSGHGSQLPTSDYNETDGMDECLCPVDYAFEKKDNGFIRDGWLNKVLVAGLPVGAKLRACFDSCHSGSCLDLPYIWTKGKSYVKETNLIVNRNVIFISGCKDTQTSADATIVGKRSGAMTWALLESMKSLEKNHKVTWNDVVDLMQTKLKQSRYEQIPQLSFENPDELNEVIDLVYQ